MFHFRSTLPNPLSAAKDTAATMLIKTKDVRYIVLVTARDSMRSTRTETAQ